MATRAYRGNYRKGNNMSELQTEDGATFSEEVPETGTVESGAELAPASGEGHEQKPEGFNQEAANKAINKKHFQMKEAERSAEASRKEAEELRVKLQTMEQGSEPIVPAIPDPYSENYEAEVKAYGEAIQQKTQFDQRAVFAQEQQSRTQQEAQQAEDKRVNDLLSGFNNRATQLGLDQNEIDQAGDTVAQYGINRDLVMFLLEDAEGPLITKYLAKNPLELEALRVMNPMQAAIKVNSEIRQRASSMKPQVSGAPDPAEVLQGNGAPEQESPLIKGATFE